CARMASLRSVGSIRMSGWPRLTVCPTSTKRFTTFPGTRNPRSLCTRAATIPVNERSDWPEISTVSIRTSGGCIRGSVEEEVASLHAAKTKGNRPMRLTKEYFPLMTLSFVTAPRCICNYTAKKISACGVPVADSLHGWVQLLHEPAPKNLLDLLLRLAPGRNRLFQELASLWCQAKRLRAAILVRHNFQPATSLHAFDVAAEGRNVEMQMFANLNRTSRAHLGGGDENVHLAHLQVERPQGVVVDV